MNSMSRFRLVMRNKLRQIRDKQRNKPKRQKHTLRLIRRLFHPCGKDRHIQIKSYQHIDIPHWRRIDRKGYRDQSDRLQRLYKRGRRVRFPREKVRHQFRLPPIHWMNQAPDQTKQTRSEMETTHVECASYKRQKPLA